MSHKIGNIADIASQGMILTASILISVRSTTPRKRPDKLDEVRDRGRIYTYLLPDDRLFHVLHIMLGRMVDSLMLFDTLVPQYSPEYNIERELHYIRCIHGQRGRV